MSLVSAFVRNRHIAYFSMEIALRPEIHTYAGGLGVLAGDTARACAALELPLVFVTLVSREGYLAQEIDPHGRQINRPDPWDPEPWASPLLAKVAVPIEGREVWVRPWLYVVEGPSNYAVPVIMLDTGLEENAPEDRQITHRLYGGDQAYRLRQEIVLGIGGVRVLTALGFEIHTYHLNEGHAALLCLELLRRRHRPADAFLPDESSEWVRELCTACLYDVVRVREMCVFTSHTPVEAGQDRFPYALIERTLPDLMELDQLRLLGGSDAFNMTRVALKLSSYVKASPSGTPRPRAACSQATGFTPSPTASTPQPGHARASPSSTTPTFRTGSTNRSSWSAPIGFRTLRSGRLTRKQSAVCSTASSSAPA